MQRTYCLRLGWELLSITLFLIFPCRCKAPLLIHVVLSKMHNYEVNGPIHAHAGQWCVLAVTSGTQFQNYTSFNLAYNYNICLFAMPYCNQSHYRFFDQLYSVYCIQFISPKNYYIIYNTVDNMIISECGYVHLDR